MKRRAWIIGLLMAIPLTLGLQQVVRDLLVAPVLYLVWLATLLWHWIPQSFFWYLFLIIPLFGLGRSLTRHSKPRRTTTAESGDVSGPVSLWDKRLREATHNQHLCKLLSSILVHTSGKSPAEIRQALKAGNSGLPDELIACLKSAAGGASNTPTTPSGISRLRKKAGNRSTDAASPEPEAIVGQMALLLEVKHDRD